MDAPRETRRRRRHAQAGIVFAAWNTHNASRARLKRYVRSQLRAGAAAIVLTEVWSRHAELRDIAKRYGLRLLAETPEPGGRARALVSERGDTVVLLSPGFVLESWDVIALTERWHVDSAGRWHEPRRLLIVRGHVLGHQRVELLAVHGPTNNGHKLVRGRRVQGGRRTSPGQHRRRHPVRRRRRHEHPPRRDPTLGPSPRAARVRPGPRPGHRQHRHDLKDRPAPRLRPLRRHPPPPPRSLTRRRPP